MKNKLGIILILACSLVVCFAGCGSDDDSRYTRNREPKGEATSSSIIDNLQANAAFTKLQIDKIGKHTYIDQTYFDRTNRDASWRVAILQAIDEADDCLDCDIYVTGVGSAMESGEYRIFADFYKNGVIYEDVDFLATKGRKGEYEWGCASCTASPQIDTKNIIRVDSVIDQVYDLAEANKDQIFEHVRPEPISGYYSLCYNDTDGLFYDFRINTYSEIKVDAYTGKIISEYYWDGCYVD